VSALIGVCTIAVSVGLPSTGLLQQPGRTPPAARIVPHRVEARDATALLHIFGCPGQL
jgi:hypothetical protein